MWRSMSYQAGTARRRYCIAPGSSVYGAHEAAMLGTKRAMLAGDALPLLECFQRLLLCAVASSWAYAAMAIQAARCRLTRARACVL